MTKWAMLLIVMGLLVCVGDALGLSVEGAAIPGGSWSQTFGEDPPGLFDRMVVTMQSGSLEVPYIAGFSAGSWTVSGGAASATAQAADAVDSLTFTLNFAGSMSSPLSFHFEAYSGLDSVDSTLASWSGSAWSLTHQDLVPVPEPVTMMTALLAIGGFGLYIRRHTRKPGEPA